jgi:hypothetical protein
MIDFNLLINRRKVSLVRTNSGIQRCVAGFRRILAGDWDSAARTRTTDTTQRPFVQTPAEGWTRSNTTITARMARVQPAPAGRGGSSSGRFNNAKREKGANRRTTNGRSRGTLSWRADGRFSEQEVRGCALPLVADEIYGFPSRIAVAAKTIP